MISADILIECSVTGERSSAYMVSPLNAAGAPTGWKVVLPEGWTLNAQGEPFGPHAADPDPSTLDPDLRFEAQRQKDRRATKAAQAQARKPFPAL